MTRLLPVLVVALAVTLAGTTLPSAADPTGASTPDSGVQARTAALPLRGVTIALDPGHQLGNHSASPTFKTGTARIGQRAVAVISHVLPWRVGEGWG